MIEILKLKLECNHLIKCNGFIIIRAIVGINRIYRGFNRHSHPLLKNFRASTLLVRLGSDA